MKKYFLLLLATGGLLAPAFGLKGAATASDDNKSRPVALQVKVTLPASSMSPIREDDVAEAFGYRIGTSLHEQGFQGRVSYLDRNDRVNPAVPLLTLNLIEWRVDAIGNVDCRFNATIKSTAGTKQIGLFTGQAMFAWQDRTYFDREGKFDDAVTDAASNLLKKIRASGILPERND